MLPIAGFLVLGLLAGQTPTDAPPPSPDAPAARKIPVFVLGVTSKDVDASVVKQTNALIAQAASTHPAYSVITVEDVAEVARLEHDREMLGAEGGDPGRLADAARGLGAEVVIAGTLGGVGAGFALTIHRVDVKTATATSRTASLSNVEEIPAAVPKMIAELLMPMESSVALGAGAVPPSRDSPRTKVVVMGVKSTRDIDEDTVKQTNVLIAQAVTTHPGYTVTTVEDVAEVAKLTKDREMLGGDSADAALLADAARGLAAQYVVTGKLSRTGLAYVLTLQSVEVKTSAAKSETETLRQLKDIPAAVQRMVSLLMGFPDQPPVQRYTLPSGVKTSFAVMDLTASGVGEEVAANLTQVLSAEIKKVENTSVVSRQDIQAMLQMEVTKSLAGCDEESCLAEIGGALGVEKLVAGSVGKLGDSFVVSLRLIAVKDVSVENRATESFTGPPEQLIHAVRTAARNLIGLQIVDRGTLSVTASEVGAAVIVDGKRAGVVPIAPLAGLTAGAHTVEIEKPGYVRWVSDAYIHPSETTSVWATLKAVPPKFYQRPIFWLATLGGGGLLVAIPLGIVTGLVVGGAVLLQLSANEASAGNGTATVKVPQ